MPTRVLIADHDEALLASYTAYLAGEGFGVATARSGLECLEQLRHSLPDILVLDLELPWGGGAGVLARMPDGSDVPPVPVLVLSAIHQPAALAELVHFPMMTDFHIKPLGVDPLARIIRRLFDEGPIDIRAARPRAGSTPVASVGVAARGADVFSPVVEACDTGAER